MAQKTSEITKKFGKTEITYGYVYEEALPENKSLIYKLNKVR